MAACFFTFVCCIIYYYKQIINIDMGSREMGGSFGGADVQIRARTNRRNNVPQPDRRAREVADEEFGHRGRLVGLAHSADIARNSLETRYWPLAEKKGIKKDHVYVFRGQEFKVFGLELIGRNCLVILRGGISGTERLEVNLNSPLWEKPETFETK
jgi:hypothetical protein